MKLAELLESLGGTLAQGAGNVEVDGVHSAANAGPREIVFAEDEASAARALAGSAGVVVLKPGLAADYGSARCVLETPHPRLWFARAAQLLKPQPPAQGIHRTAVVGAGAEFGEDVTVGPGAVIGAGARIGAETRIEAGAVIGEGVTIGERCRIYPRVVIYPGATIGDRVVLHAGAVLGADGFGYVRDPKTGAHTQFPQQGTLVVEDEVEVGANTTIDRGALGETRIRRGAKFDNLVHVAHNCDIGEDAIIVAQVGISGSSTVGRGAVLAGQVGMGDHAHVGDGVILGGQSGVFPGKTVTNKGLPPGSVHYGTPARPLRQVLREQAVLTRLAKRSGPTKLL